MTFIDIAREFFEAVASELDPYTTDKSKIIENDKNSLSLLTVKHIQFAKYGRGKGKRPPLGDILAFVKSKKIQFRNKKGRFISSKGTAFAIMNSIAKKGTKNYVPNAPNAIEEAINNNILNYRTKLNKFTLDTQFAKLNKIYNENLSRKITIKI